LCLLTLGRDGAPLDVDAARDRPAAREHLRELLALARAFAATRARRAPPVPAVRHQPVHATRSRRPRVASHDERHEA
jgi:hypothetical protein